MKQFTKVTLIIVCVFLITFCFSCAGRQKQDTTTTGAPATQVGADTQDDTGEGKLEEADISAKEFGEVSAVDPELAALFQNIHFDFDDFSLRPDAKKILDTIAEWLLQNTANQILIEGHCDERGTNEYNLALGERRANSAKKYLMQLGVSSKRIFTISYGEEKPICTEKNEGCYTQNRRAHFLMR